MYIFPIMIYHNRGESLDITSSMDIYIYTYTPYISLNELGQNVIKYYVTNGVSCVDLQYVSTINIKSCPT